MQVIFELPDGERHAVTGEAGATVMRVATLNNIPGITGDCGGGCACGTCHIYVDPRWIDRVGAPEAGSIEAEMIDLAPADAQPNSRLGCQIILTSDLDGLVVQVPEGQ
jgi:2Fe-2S ferredoxin